MHNWLKILFSGVSLGGLLGGFLYDRYGGVQTFQLFSYGSLSTCILHLIYTKYASNKSNQQVHPNVEPGLWSRMEMAWLGRSWL